MLHLTAHHAGTRRLSDTLRRAVPLAESDGHRCATAKDRGRARRAGMETRSVAS